MTSPGPALPFRTRFPPALAQGLTFVCGCTRGPRMPLAQHAWRIRFDCSLWPSFWRTPAPVRAAPNPFRRAFRAASEAVRRTARTSGCNRQRLQNRERSGPQARGSEQFHRGSIHRGSARFHTAISPRARAWAHLVLAVPPSSHPLQHGHALQSLTPAGILPNSDAPFARLRIRCRRSFRCAFSAASEAGRRPAGASGFIADQYTPGARGPSVLASGRCAKHFPGGAETLVPHPPSVNGQR